jgi:hypothetical protein
MAQNLLQWLLCTFITFNVPPEEQDVMKSDLQIVMGMFWKVLMEYTPFGSSLSKLEVVCLSTITQQTT